MIRISNITTITATVAEKKLKESYDRGASQLAESDNRNLCKDLLTAYNDIVGKAFHADLSPLPLLVRYRCLDSEGITCYVSPVKLFVAGDTMPFTSLLTTTVAGNSRSVFNVNVDAFGLSLDTNIPLFDNEDIKTVIVEAAPAVPTVDVRLATTDCRVVASTGALRFYMPGTSVDMAPDEVCISLRVLATLQDYGNFYRPLLRVNPHGVNAGKVIDIPLSALLYDRPEEMARNTLERLGQRIRSVTDPYSQRHVTRMKSLMYPHCYVASVKAVNGEIMLSGAPRREPWPGWEASEWALTTSSQGTWSGTVIVEMADGSRRSVSRVNMSGPMPETLTPLWYYPEEDAVAMEIRLRGARGTAVIRRQLQALPGSGLAAVGIHGLAGLRPIKPEYTGASFEMPDNEVAVQSLERLLVSSRTADPHRVLDVMEIPAGRMLAIMPATANNSAWDYARHRFYVITDGGIYLAVVNDKGKIVSLQLIDGRGVVSTGHIAGLPGNGAVYVAAAGRLLCLRASRVRDVGAVPDALERIEIRDCNLWLHTARDAAVIVPLSLLGEVTPDISGESRSGPVLWRGRMSASRRICDDSDRRQPAEVELITIDITQPLSDIVIRVYADNGIRSAKEPKLLQKITLRGEVIGRLTLPVLARGVNILDVRITKAA